MFLIMSFALETIRDSVLQCCSAAELGHSQLLLETIGESVMYSLKRLLATRRYSNQSGQTWSMVDLVCWPKEVILLLRDFLQSPIGCHWPLKGYFTTQSSKSFFDGLEKDQWWWVKRWLHPSLATMTGCCWSSHYALALIRGFKGSSKKESF